MTQIRIKMVVGISMMAVVFCAGTIQAQTLHVLLVAHTVDKNMRESCEADLDLMSSVFYACVPPPQLNFVAKAGPESEEIALTGKDVSRQAVFTAINRCSVGPDDAFVFYWSGLGAYDDDGHYMQMPAQEALYRSEVIGLISQKRPRLTVILTDTYNTFLKNPFPVPQTVPSIRKPKEVAPLFDELFFRSTGLVDITASAPGEVAFGNEDAGGLLTLALACPGEIEGTLESGAHAEPKTGTNWMPAKSVFWKGALRRLMWQDVVREASAGVNRLLAAQQKKPPGLKQRAQTVTSWSLPPILREDDHLISINGRSVSTIGGFQRAVRGSPRGMMFAINRLGERLHMKATLRNGSGLRFGVYTDDNDGQYGVRITKVESGSPATRAQLIRHELRPVLMEKGDVILSVNGEEISSVEQFNESIRPATSEGPEIYFAIKNYRNGRIHYLKDKLSPGRFALEVRENGGEGVRVDRVRPGLPGAKPMLAN